MTRYAIFAVFATTLMLTVSFAHELPIISVESVSPTVEEGRPLIFEVLSDKASDSPLSIPLQLTGDAFEILHYLPKELSVRLQPEQTSAHVELITLNDDVKKSDATIILSIIAEEFPNNAFKVDSSSASAKVILVDND